MDRRRPLSAAGCVAAVRPAAALRPAAIALASVAVVLASALSPSAAHAHDFSPGVLTLVEEEPGVYRYAFAPPVDDGLALEAAPTFPTGCTRAAHRLRCPGGLVGDVHFAAALDRRAQIVVFFEPLGGPRSETLVGGDDPVWRVSAPPSPSRWVLIGAEHVLFGFDHLAFVLGLLLVVAAGRRRIGARVAMAVTAFTVAHSITLALATLGHVRLPPPPVEAAIAASVMLLALEALREGPSLTRDHPWAVAFVFGLVHGLGFAAALGDLGVTQTASTLLLFNGGVELAQLAVVAVGLAARWALGAERGRNWARVGTGYALGVAGTYWLIDRCLQLGT